MGLTARQRHTLPDLFECRSRDDGDRQTRLPDRGEGRQGWWMGQVIHCGGAARNPMIHNLFEIADVDSGVIRRVNADLVTHIVPSTVF